MESFVKNNFGLMFDYFLSKDVLEVGCGPYGVIHFVDCRVNVGIDPLLFDTWKGDRKINASTIHVVAAGEYLPFRDGVFDVCICFNVLDHVISPNDVMREMVRILKSDGELLLWVHAIRRSVKIFDPLFSLIDRSHPHHFTSNEVFRLVKECALNITSMKKEHLGKGTFIQRFLEALPISLKLAVASLLVFNIFIVAKRTSL